MIETKFEPATMAAARHSRQLTLAELAKRTGISTSSLSRAESGLRKPTENELDRIASALEYPIEMFGEQLPTAALGLPGFYHRRLSRAGVRSVRRVEGHCLVAAIGLQRLTRLVEISAPYEIPALELNDFNGNPERAAEVLRLAWQLPRGPISNLAGSIERAGGLVIHLDFDVESMDAMYQTVPGLPPIFWVNSRKPADRVRFSLAHELGHAVLHHVPTDHSEAEKQADAFAAAFLMPAADFRRECPTRLKPSDLAQLKRRWCVSMAAIIRRARTIGRITETQYQSLMVQMSRMGWRKHEPVELPPESPSLLADLLRTCVTEGCYSRAELGTALRLPEEMIRDWEQPVPRHDKRNSGPRFRLVV